MLLMTAAPISIEDLQQQNATLSAEILSLKEQLEWFKRQIFGKRSERVIGANPDQLQFEGFENSSQQEVPTQTIPAHERKTRTSTGKDTIKLPEDLPMETTLIDIPCLLYTSDAAEDYMPV
jgi:transposase